MAQCTRGAASQRGDNLGYARHSEKACLNEIQQELTQGAQILQVYTERFPCGPQNQNCYSFLQNHSQIGPNVRVYWGIEWPDALDLTGKPKPGKGKRDNEKKEYDLAAKKAKVIREAGNKLCKEMGATFLTPGPWGS